jgi:hypothetical protein
MIYVLVYVFMVSIPIIIISQAAAASLSEYGYSVVNEILIRPSSIVSFLIPRPVVSIPPDELVRPSEYRGRQALLVGVSHHSVSVECSLRLTTVPLIREQKRTMDTSVICYWYILLLIMNRNERHSHSHSPVR